jgi:predicted DNA-binding protein
MSGVVQAPFELIEAIASLRLPTQLDRRLQELMERRTEDSLTVDQRENLEALVELSEILSLVRAQALRLLERGPA